MWELCIQRRSRHISRVCIKVYSLPHTPISITVTEVKGEKNRCPSLRQVNKRANNSQGDQMMWGFIIYLFSYYAKMNVRMENQM